VVDNGHKYFGERGGDGDASIIFWIGGIAFALVKWDDFGCSPRGRWGLGDGAGIEESG
jgi:hypothetical protein